MTARRFRFRLDRLLSLRKQRERAARRQLAAAVAEVHVLESRLADVGAQRRGFADAAAGLSPVAALAGALEGGLHRAQRRLEQERHRAQQNLQTQRDAWAQRRRDVQVLARLRERRLEAFTAEAQKAEQAQIDELARLGFARRRDLVAERGERVGA